MYKTDCPKCGAPLAVTSFTAECHIPLQPNGFSEVDATRLNTDEEVVTCADNCGFMASLYEMDLDVYEEES